MKCDKVLEDSWSSSPPQVTSVITFARLSNPGEFSAVVHTSPACGLGWRFNVVEKYISKPSEPNSKSQNKSLVATVQLSFHPPSPLFTVFAFNAATVHVKVTYPDSSSHITHEQKYSEYSLKEVRQLGLYEEPSQYRGRTHIAISLIFDASDNLSFPTTPHPSIKDILGQSLDDPLLIDTKFYLFSAKRRLRPTAPKVVYGQSRLFAHSGSYLESLLSSDMGFSSGTPCLLREETPQEIAKLRAETYDYDSDSDLESLPDEEDDNRENELSQGHQLTGNPSMDVLGVKRDSKEKDIEVTNPKENSKQITKLASDALEVKKRDLPEPIAPAGPLDGRAFAINGTAYKTWKAFILYTYTNNIQFDNLKSENKPNVEMKTVSCSPKSMYRLADYVGSIMLKSIAKDGIRQRLSKSNIITEIFSAFTCKYREIIEMEIDYLLQEFDSHLAQKLDEILQQVVVGGKPHCHRVLVFLMRRHRGEPAEKAWKALADNRLDGLFSGTEDTRKNPFAFVSESSSWSRSPHGNRLIASSSRVSRSQRQAENQTEKRLNATSFTFRSTSSAAGPS